MGKKGGKKKVVKKAKAKVAHIAPQRAAMAIVPFSEIAKPDMYRGKMTLAPSPLTEKQIMAIVAPTPKHIIKERPGKGGGTWSYIPGWWFKKKANFVFGFAHDFEILGERIDGDFVTVKGKVTVRDPKTNRLIATKTDFGGAAIKFKKDGGHTSANYLDIPNDFKAAATDCFKRCMVQFGFAMDIYGKSESIEAGQVVQNDVPQQVTAPAKTEGSLDICDNCGFPISKQIKEYSLKFYKKALCADCQKLTKKS